MSNFFFRKKKIEKSIIITIARKTGAKRGKKRENKRKEDKEGKTNDVF